MRAVIHFAVTDHSMDESFLKIGYLTKNEGKVPSNSIKELKKFEFRPICLKNKYKFADSFLNLFKNYHLNYQEIKYFEPHTFPIDFLDICQRKFQKNQLVQRHPLFFGPKTKAMRTVASASLRLHRIAQPILRSGVCVSCRSCNYQLKRKKL